MRITPTRKFAGKPASEPWTKVDIIHLLADVYGYCSYLEICTPTSGLRYAEIDWNKFKVCHRLVYNCRDDFADGLGIDFRSASLEIDSCLGAIRGRNLRYDIILVDPWHEYETSYRDLAAALELVEDHGAIIVHDCLPADEAMASPQVVANCWCGVTYKAYLDFVTARDDISYLTVDTDLGCGVIRRPGPPASGWLHWRKAARAVVTPRNRLVQSWGQLGDDFPAAYAFFEKNHRALLKLVSVKEFQHEVRRKAHL